MLTASWPRGLNTEIVASGCQSGVAAFTGEQTARRGREKKKRGKEKQTQLMVYDVTVRMRSLITGREELNFVE